MEVSTTQLCDILGCTRAYVSLLTKQGMPKVDRGRYDLRWVVPWLQEHARQGTLRQSQRASPLQAARVRLYEARIAQMELKTAQLERKLGRTASSG